MWEEHDACADQMKDAESHVGFWIEEVCCYGDEHATGEDEEPALEVPHWFFGVVVPGDDEADSDEEEEQSCCSPSKEPPGDMAEIPWDGEGVGAIVDGDIPIVEVPQIEGCVVGDHGQDCDGSEEIKLEVASGGGRHTLTLTLSRGEREGELLLLLSLEGNFRTCLFKLPLPLCSILF